VKNWFPQNLLSNSFNLYRYTEVVNQVCFQVIGHDVAITMVGPYSS
jgi:hypothetical protein